jgi:NitT/TauT family transport system permease protein
MDAGSETDRVAKGKVAAMEDKLDRISVEFLEARRAEQRRYQVFLWSIRIGLAAAFLWSWEIAADSGLINPFFFSKPSIVWGFLREFFTTGEIWRHIAATLYATLLGFAVGAGLAVPTGLLLGRFPVLDEILAPFLAGLNALPRVALAPIFILWFGIGLTSKVVLVASLVFFIVLINTQAGIRSIDEELIRMARAMGATSRQRFLKIVLPGAVPAIFAGFRVGIIYALLGAVVGEMVAAPAGLGQQVSLFSGTYRTGGVLAVLLILSLIGMGMNSLTLLLERYLLRWQR